MKWNAFGISITSCNQYIRSLNSLMEAALKCQKIFDVACIFHEKLEETSKFLYVPQSVCTEEI